MEEIILKHLNKGKLSREEEAKLERWLNTDQKNARIFNQLKLNLKGASPEQMRGMKDKVWEQLSGRIQQPVSLPASRNLLLSNWLKIAAVFILTIGLGSLLYYESLDNNTENRAERIIIEKESQYGHKLTFALPDGSIVKLNAGSKIVFPKDFDLNKREIKLFGEAFFDIKRDVNRPFRIITDHMNVEVLGTSFNVKSYANEAEMSVAVRTGQVSVDLLKDDSHFLLEPNELVVYTPSEGKATKQILEDSQLAFGWIEKKLVYKNANITQILKDLSRWYGVDFEINRTLDYEKKISGRYDNPSLVDVLKSLSFAYEFEFTIDEKKIMIK